MGLQVVNSGENLIESGRFSRLVQEVFYLVKKIRVDSQFFNQCLVFH